MHGLFLEGAKWDPEYEFIRSSDGELQKGGLVDQAPKVLFTSFPVMWLKPRAKIEAGDHSMADTDPGATPIPGYYTCPIYKTAERKGVLSTTGQSTNFVMPAFVPTDKPGQFWTKRAVAMLTQLSD